MKLQTARATGPIGDRVLQRDMHGNVSGSDWFTGALAVTNSFVHDIEISRWRRGSAMVSAQVTSAHSGGRYW